MPKKSLKPARGVSSLPRLGKHNAGPKESQSTRSRKSTSKQFEEPFAETKAAEAEAPLRGDQAATKEVPRHLVSHLLPYFYPDEYEPELPDADRVAEVPLHLASHVTPYCYPVAGTVDSEEDAQSPRSPEVPRHLESHVTAYCFPVTGTADTVEDAHTPRPDVVLPHLESHVELVDDGNVVESQTVGTSKRAKLPEPRRTNYVPPHLRSQLFTCDDDCGVRNERTDDRQRGRTGISCAMTQTHANVRDTVFAPPDDLPPRRRRYLLHKSMLFDNDSGLRPRPTSIAIVQRSPEDTKDNIFGSDSFALLPRRPWENDTKKTLFGCSEEAPAPTMPPPRRGRHEDTMEKLFGQTYGWKEVEQEIAQRRRACCEDTHMTLFGLAPPPPPPTPHRPQSARSCTSTHDNLFGHSQPPTPQSSRRSLRRENTFHSLFGDTAARSATPSTTDVRYTAKNPKIVEVSLSSSKCR